jgi:hypothetical protein
VEADLHQTYGLDVWDDALMDARPWSWLRSRIVGLLTENTRTARALIPMEVPSGVAAR